MGSAAKLLLSLGGNAGLVVVGHRHGVVGATFGLSVGDRVAAQHHTDVSAEPVSALLDASSKAAAIVVGRHGTGGLAVGASLGSVSRALVQSARCPVFLVG